jgi:tetratricopeptide (TPR) repeat protein
MLKIGSARNAYDLLGLPRSATSVQLRARFRQLVRGYRKELATPDLVKDEHFRELANAYLQLTGPARKEYDRRLRESRGRERPEDLLAHLPEPKLMLMQAEAAFVRRKLNEAVEVARAAVKQDRRNAEGYALLGDVLREQGRYNDALTMYNYAIQFDPNNPRYWQLLQEITALRDGRALPRRYGRERPTAFNRPLAAWVSVGVAFALAGLGLVLAGMHPGEVLFFNIPRSLAYAAGAGGFLLGLALAATAVIAPFDDEMVWYQIAGFGVETTPVGLFVIPAGLVFFWLALPFYAVCAWLDEHVSLSIVIALFVAGLLAIASAVIGPPEARTALYALGGNIAFFGFLWGWAFGSIRKRVFEH